MTASSGASPRYVAQVRPTATDVHVLPEAQLVLSTLKLLPLAPPGALELSLLRGLNSLDGAARIMASSEYAKLTHAVAAVYGDVLDGPHPLRALLESYSAVADLLTERQIGALSQAARALTTAGIRFLVPKGILLHNQLLPGRPRPISADVDLLVAAVDLQATAATLDSLGYRQGPGVRNRTFLSLSRKQVAAYEASPDAYGQVWAYAKIVGLEELKPFIPFISAHLGRRLLVIDGERAYGLDQFDLHYDLNMLAGSTGLNDRVPPAEWWNDADTVDVQGTPVELAGARTLSWFLPYHYYQDTMSMHGRDMKILGDLVLLARSGSGIDWDYVAHIGRRYGHIRPALHWVYRFLAEHADVDVPAGVLEDLARPSESTYADWGSIVPQLFDAPATFDLISPAGSPNR